jgi:hypothetical protein
MLGDRASLVDGMGTTAAVEQQHVMPSALIAVLVVAGILLFLALVLYANQAG